MGAAAGAAVAATPRLVSNLRDDATGLPAAAAATVAVLLGAGVPIAYLEDVGLAFGVAITCFAGYFGQRAAVSAGDGGALLLAAVLALGYMFAMSGHRGGAPPYVVAPEVCDGLALHVSSGAVPRRRRRGRARARRCGWRRAASPRRLRGVPAASPRRARATP